MIFSQVFILLITHTNAIALPAFWQHNCLRGNYTTNSTYHANLNHLMSILPSQEGNGYGFYSLSYGNSSDQVYAIGLCRGDPNPDLCSSCLNNATQLCPSQREAVGWYDYCMLRYSNRSMFGIKEISLKAWLINPNNESSNFKDEFFQDLRTLLDGLKNRAASSGSLLKFATANMSAPEFRTIYAIVQCTPDLSQKDCNNCLDDAFADVPGCCYWRIGGRVIGTNCHLGMRVTSFTTKQMMHKLLRLHRHWP